MSTLPVSEMETTNVPLATNRKLLSVLDPTKERPVLSEAATPDAKTVWEKFCLGFIEWHTHPTRPRPAPEWAPKIIEKFVIAQNDNPTRDPSEWHQFCMNVWDHFVAYNNLHTITLVMPPRPSTRTRYWTKEYFNEMSLGPFPVERTNRRIRSKVHAKRKILSQFEEFIREQIYVQNIVDPKANRLEARKKILKAEYSLDKYPEVREMLENSDSDCDSDSDSSSNESDAEIEVYKRKQRKAVEENKPVLQKKIPTNRPLPQILANTEDEGKWQVVQHKKKKRSSENKEHKLDIQKPGQNSRPQPYKPVHAAPPVHASGNVPRQHSPSQKLTTHPALESQAPLAAYVVQKQQKQKRRSVEGKNRNRSNALMNEKFVQQPAQQDLNVRHASPIKNGQKQQMTPASTSVPNTQQERKTEWAVVASKNLLTPALKVESPPAVVHTQNQQQQQSMKQPDTLMENPVQHPFYKNFPSLPASTYQASTAKIQIQKLQQKLQEKLQLQQKAIETKNVNRSNELKNEKSAQQLPAQQNTVGTASQTIASQKHLQTTAKENSAPRREQSSHQNLPSLSASKNQALATTVQSLKQQKQNLMQRNNTKQPALKPSQQNPARPATQLRQYQQNPAANRAPRQQEPMQRVSRPPALSEQAIQAAHQARMQYKQNLVSNKDMNRPNPWNNARPTQQRFQHRTPIQALPTIQKAAVVPVNSPPKQKDEWTVVTHKKRAKTN